MHVNLEIGQNMEGISPVWPGDLLFHKSLDGGGALDRAKSAYPFPVFGEKSRVRREVTGVEVAAIVEQDSLDFLNVLNRWTRAARALLSWANSGISVTRKMRLARMAFTSTRVYHCGAYSPSKKSVLTFFTS